MKTSILSGVSGFEESIIERGRISAAVNNSKMWLKYNRYAFKSNLYSKEHTLKKMDEVLSELKNVEFLVLKYHVLWQEKFSEIKLKTEKFIQELTK